MGLTPVKVKIGDFGSDNLYDADFVVDTGSMDSMAPASELRRVGIKPVGKRLCELASGEVQEYEYGHAKLWFMNEMIATTIIFGPVDFKPTLGRRAANSGLCRRSKESGDRKAPSTSPKAGSLN